MPRRCSSRAALLLAAVLAAAAPATAPAPARAAGAEFVVTFGGDVNFARSREAPSADVVRKGTTLPLADATRLLAKEWAGADLNFVNVETVVSVRDGAPSGTKAFVFRSHPEQFRHLLALGANAFSLANNHGHDHGWQGLADTLSFFEGEDRPDRPILHAGIGGGAAAYKPRLARIAGVRVALAALTFGAPLFAPAGDRPGMGYLGLPAHLAGALEGLAAAPADLRILSLHAGTENLLGLDAGQRALFRRAVEEAGVNLVLGHHPHVVRAVEVEPARDAAIFHSLGNLLFVGGADKDGAGLGADYGLLGKAYFLRAGGRMRLVALEALPLKGVHLQPRTLPAERTSATLAFLNRLSAGAAGAAAAAFTPAPGAPERGIACFGGPYGPRARALCCRIARHNPHCDFPDLM
ncbi:MAG: CapA family protein [Rhodobacteraceae bacterium]|jgi:poly-gamma-glutamate synthesis protein (capsule biosynthesis protein)|nr:CapA family protein [Paracoccaceae bacterium]